jgi:VanZ family protein
MKISHLSTCSCITGFMILALSTIVSVSWVEPYKKIGNDLLQNKNFSSGLTGWEKSSSGKITLHNNSIQLQLENREDDVRIEQKIYNPSDYQYLRLAADIKTNHIVPGEMSWHRARLILSSYDEDGNWLSVPHGVAGLEGTNNWQHFERIFKLSPLADQVSVIAMLHKASGSVWFKNISLTEVTAGSAWKILTITALLVWGIFLFMILFPWIKDCKRYLQKIVILSVILAIILGTMVPHSYKELIKTNSSAKLAENRSLSFEGVTEKRIEARHHSNLKWKMINNTGHILFFFILAAMLVLGFRDKNHQIFLTILILACATELMQFFIEGRSPGFRDLILDLAGAFFGAIAIKTILWARTERLS